MIGVQLAQLALQVQRQKPHDARHFILRAIPILGGEGVQREILDARLGCGANDGPRGINPAPMAFYPRQSIGFGPAPVAIHDHRNMRRQHFPGLWAEVCGARSHAGQL